ncbi:MAG: msrA peptide-methionine (S)-S-oxide reductase [Planctomycetota bacterium]|jgi:peptide-methionine (S)-S-oxide reductase
MAKATIAGGCFWCVEAVFQRVHGVQDVVSGYTGGQHPNPDYHSVCSGETGHAEVVQIEFDPSIISFSDLLDIFFAIHDPTTLNRQGADEGTQYRSAIFFHDEEQKSQALAKIAQLNASGQWFKPLVTQVEKLGKFHSAEEYHQNYYSTHPQVGYCQAVIAPKLMKFMKHFPNRVRQ